MISTSPIKKGQLEDFISNSTQAQLNLKGDMTTNTLQNVSGVKTFFDGTMGLRNVSNTFTSFFTNTNTASRTYVWPDKNGTVALLSDISSGTVGGTGTPNYISKWSSTTGLANSLIYDNGTNVLIGTTTDNGIDKFQVNGSVYSTIGYKISGGLASQFLKANGTVDNNVYLTGYTETDNLQSVTDRGSLTTKGITANSFATLTGTSLQFLKADGSVDLTLYENSLNKQNSMTIDGTGQKFPTVDAVNFQTNNIARAVVATGFLDTTDSFRLYVVDNNTLGISASTFGIAFSNKFKTALQAPAAPSEALVYMSARTVSLSSIGLTGYAKTVKYVGYEGATDKIVFSDTTFIQSSTVCQLGVVLLKVTNGVTTFLDANRNVVTQPDIAAYSNLDTTSTGFKTTVLVKALDADMRITNTSGALIGISTNWHGGNNDSLPILASPVSGLTFSYLYPGMLKMDAAITSTTTIDPTVYWNGTSLVSTGNQQSASIQRILLTIGGKIVIQYGEAKYASLDDAKAAVDIQTYTDILPVGTYAEIGRLIVRQDCSDLTNPLKAIFTATGGGNAPSSSAVAWGGITGSIGAQADLQLELNAKQNLLTTSSNINISGVTAQDIKADGGTKYIEVRPDKFISKIGQQGVPYDVFLPYPAIQGNPLTLVSDVDVNRELNDLDATVLHKDGDEIKNGSLTVTSIIKSGGTSSQYLMADGSVSTGKTQFGDDTNTPSASNVGTLRYREDASASYVDMVMKTSSTTYEWINIVQNNF